MSSDVKCSLSQFTKGKTHAELDSGLVDGFKFVDADRIIFETNILRVSLSPVKYRNF